MLDGVKARAVREHPAGEDPLDIAIELDLVDLDEGRRVRGLGRGPRVAHPRRHLQRPELLRLIDRDLQRQDAPRHLVERRERRDRILDVLG